MRTASPSPITRRGLDENAGGAPGGEHGQGLRLRRLPARRGGASSSTAASASPGSTTCTSTSSARRARGSPSATPPIIASGGPARGNLCFRNSGPPVKRVRRATWAGGCGAIRARGRRRALFADHEEIRTSRARSAAPRWRWTARCFSMRSWAARDPSGGASRRRPAVSPATGPARSGDRGRPRAQLQQLAGRHPRLHRADAARGESEAARRRLMVIRDVALGASATVP